MAIYDTPDNINVNQSLKFTDGEYGEVQNSGSEELQVFLPERGFDLLYKNPNRNSGSTEITIDLDKRFKLGTYTLNNRGYWEDENTNPNTLQAYLSDEELSLKPKTIPSETLITPDGDVVEVVGGWTSSELKWSIDALPFVVNPNDDSIVEVDKYYDRLLDKEKYELATEGKINFYLQLREDRRTEYKNIDVFKNANVRTAGGGQNFFDYYIGDGGRGLYLFKLNWGDGTELEFDSEPKLLESTVIFEHFYDEPGFYSITGIIYQYTGPTYGIKQYEKFQTNILLNPSPDYDNIFFNYNNFASIGGVSKSSAYVKSLNNLVGIDPLNPSDNTKSSINLLEKFNEFDKIQILNTLGKIDYSMIQPYVNFLSPYQTPTDDVDSFLFGCADPNASNYYLDISGSLPENTTLVDDGTCNYQHSVRIFVGGPSSDNELPIPITIQEGVDDSARSGVAFETAMGDDELTIRQFSDSSELQQGLPTITTVGDTGSPTLNIVNRGGVTFSLIEDEILGDDENGLAFYDWNFAGWYKRLMDAPLGTSPELIGTDLSVTTEILQDTEIFARFYYLDVTPPGPVRYNSENWDYKLFYNREEIFDETRPNRELTTIPYNSFVILFEEPEEATETFEYNDIDYFRIERIYYDYIVGQDVIEEIAQIPFDTEKVTQRMPNGFNFPRYRYIDENLPYREYGYRVTSVDTSELESETVTSEVRKYPTPSDEQPAALDSNLFTLEQINNKDLGINWQQITEAWPGLEGNFKHFKIEIQGPNGIDDVVQFVGDYNTEEDDSLITNEGSNIIPTSYSSLNDVGTDIFNNGLGYKTRDTNGNLFNMSWAVKISVVAKALDSDLEQEGDSTVQKAIAPENLLEPATIEVGFDSNSDYVEIIQGFFLMQGNSLNTIGFAFDPIGGTFTSISDVISVAQDGDVLEVYSAENDNIEGNYNIIIDEINNSITISPELPEPSENRFSEGTPYTAQFKLKRNITISEINAYDDREASNQIKIPIPISYSVSNGGTVPGDQVDLYMKAFIKEPTNNNPYIAVNLQNRRDLQVSSNNTVDNYEVGLDIDNFNAVINGNMHIGLFDFNDTNLLNETQAIPIQEVFGCDDTNADNFTPLATRDFNCKYSFQIETESTTQDTGFQGTIRAVKMEFVENDDGSLNFNRAEVAGQIQNNNNQPTIDYDNFQTAREFVLINLDPINAQFITWEIPIPGLEFTDDVSFQGSELIFGNTQGFTTNLDDLDYLQRGNYLAVRIVPDEDGNRIASSTNFDDKMIRVVWAEEGLEYDEDIATGTLGQDLDLPLYAPLDANEDEYNEDSDIYPALPLNFELYGTPYTGDSGYENQSSLGFVGPTSFKFMENEIDMDLYSGPYPTHINPYELPFAKLEERIIEARPIEPFELDGVTYEQLFSHWEIEEGSEFIEKIELLYNDNYVMVWPVTGTNVINYDQFTEEEHQIMNGNDRNYNAQTDWGVPYLNQIGQPILTPKITYKPDEYGVEQKIKMKAVFIQTDEDGNNGNGKQPGG